VKAQNIHDDWAKRQQTERPRARDGDESTADDFQGFYESEIAGWNHCAQKQCGRRIGRRRAHFKEVKEKVERDDVENETEQNSGDVGDEFHRSFWLVRCRRRVRIANPTAALMGIISCCGALQDLRTSLLDRVP